MKEYKVEISDEQMAKVFEIFDADKSGSVNFNEFVRVVRGDMNELRSSLVLKAFQKLDKTNTGVIEVKDIIGLFTAKNHPAVLECRKTEEEVLEEFLSTFEMHHNNTHSNPNDYSITKEEFMEYYANVSATIEDDLYFSQMLNASWELASEADMYKSFSQARAK
mmetsp:Transcript_15704/g.26476  ORF Transcript_15704/g.26476 Transcript_15704/m.26476 type:complete len:164 (+) Transcript_15704:483-974(+)